jgi:hypothetical protein
MPDNKFDRRFDGQDDENEEKDRKTNAMTIID